MDSMSLQESCHEKLKIPLESKICLVREFVLETLLRPSSTSELMFRIPLLLKRLVPFLPPASPPAKIAATYDRLDSVKSSWSFTRPTLTWHVTSTWWTLIGFVLRSTLTNFSNHKQLFGLILKYGSLPEPKVSSWLSGTRQSAHLS